MRTPVIGDHLAVDGVVHEVAAIGRQGDGSVELFLRGPSGSLENRWLSLDEYDQARLSEGSGDGDSRGALASLWGHWMQYAIPRIRSAVRATRPLTPYPHQDDAVWVHMLRQPRLRFLLADEPGTGKTIMAGMYIAEARRRALIRNDVIIVVPAHLVAKWIRDLDRFFGITAGQITDEVGRSPLRLRSDVDTWVVSVDLYTRNDGVRGKVLGPDATWSLAVFDEAHRLTPTSQYLGVGRQLAKNAHHLLLLTATPHRGKEHLFQGLLNLLDEAAFPWSADTKEYTTRRRPGAQHFLRRMKEDLKDFDGSPLFPPREPRTEPVTLSGLELDTYQSVMDYVDQWYPDRSSLARSVYGKRAASSLVAVHATLGRRLEALKSGQYPEAIPTDPFESGSDIDDPDSWDEAEATVVGAKSKNRREEIPALDSLITQVQATIDSVAKPAKWRRVDEILQHHGLQASNANDQLLVFTEYTDTARWLVGLFEQEGFSVELLSGDSDHSARDDLQRRFLTKDFQVLVSTDAGGEGIDLQSAHVMVNWDIPWSLVRLEQRMGRLHRIGQKDTVVCHQLVSRQTREGRVQEVMLENFEEAAKSLNGQIFDLMDAVADGLSFDYAAALRQAQQDTASADLAASQVPDVAALVDRARAIQNAESEMASLTNLQQANERLARDRAQAINPVIVDRFLQVLVPAAGWELRHQVGPGIYGIKGRLPGGVNTSGSTALVATGAQAVKAVWDGGGDVSGITVLGPVEDAFHSLVEHARTGFLPDLLAGAELSDDGALTSYHLFVYEATIDRYDGLRNETRPVPILIRYSAGQAFPVAWESVMDLKSGESDAVKPGPAAAHSAREAATMQSEQERRLVEAESAAWAEEALEQLDHMRDRLRKQDVDLPLNSRRRRLEAFDKDAAARREELNKIRKVMATEPRMIGWVQVRAGMTEPDLTFDPDSEKRAVATVLAELDAHGFEVDDRQTAGVGYDLHAWHPTRRELRLVEVKGCLDGLHDITLTQGEWLQAQQRGNDYWLYVVTDCRTKPTVFVRIQDPSSRFLDESRETKQFKVTAKAIREQREEQ